MRVRPNLAFVVKTPTRLESRDHMDGIHGVSEKSGDYFAPQKSGDSILSTKKWRPHLSVRKRQLYEIPNASQKWVGVIKSHTSIASSFEIYILSFSSF